MAEDKQPKGKTSFGDKVKEFFFGNRIDAYSKEEFEKMQSLFGSLSTDIEAALNQLAQTDMRLADKMAASLGKISGFTFQKSDKGKGGQIFVVHAPTGEAVGGTIATREDGRKGLLRGTKVEGDSFISKGAAVKIAKDFGKIAGADGMSAELVEKIHNASQAMQNIVPLEKSVIEVSLKKSLTTVGVVALCCLLIGGAIGSVLNKGNTKIDNNEQVRIEYRIKEVEKEIGLGQIADELLGDTQGLIDVYKSSAHYIKSCQLEEWQEYDLLKIRDKMETEQGRQQLEYDLASRLQVQKDFIERRAAIQEMKQGVTAGIVSEREYTLEVLKLTRDIHSATSNIKGEEIVAIDSVTEAVQQHLDLYNANGWQDDTHASQLEQYGYDRDSAEGSILSSREMADRYGYVIEQMEANPDMSLTDAAKLLSKTLQEGVPQATQGQGATEGGASAESGAVQE